MIEVVKLRLLNTLRKEEGDGARANRLLGEGIHLDPFVLFDEYHVYPDSSFPMHGHSGFEGFQYLMSGGTRYEDNQGNTGDIHKGGTRRFVCGDDFEHSEFPLGRETVRGYLLWVVLPPDKRSEVIYQQSNPKDLKKRTKESLTVTEIISPLGSLRSYSDVYMSLMDGGGRWEFLLEEGESGFLYTSRGDVSVGGTKIPPKSGVVLKSGINHMESSGDSEFVTVKGKRSGLDIIQDGGFVK